MRQPWFTTSQKTHFPIKGLWPAAQGPLRCHNLVCQESIIILEQLVFSALRKWDVTQCPLCWLRWTWILSAAPQGIALAILLADHHKFLDYKYAAPPSSKSTSLSHTVGLSIAVTIKGFACGTWLLPSDQKSRNRVLCTLEGVNTLENR